MPYNFTGYKAINTAKPASVLDGEVFTVADGYGQTVTSTLSIYTIFASNPVRSATGVWSVTLKDIAIKVCDVHVETMLASGSYLSTQLLKTTKSANGALVLNWVFNVAGTPTDLPSSGSPQFEVFCNYTDAG